MSLHDEVADISFRGQFKKNSPLIYLRIVCKALNFVRGHGENQLENGAYTRVSEYLELIFNTAIGQKGKPYKQF
jgi:hypothetical protein